MCVCGNMNVHVCVYTCVCIRVSLCVCECVSVVWECSASSGDGVVCADRETGGNVKVELIHLVLVVSVN